MFQNAELKLSADVQKFLVIIYCMISFSCAPVYQVCIIPR